MVSGVAGRLESVGRVRHFRLPDLGEGLTEGEILKWLVAEGDTVIQNQPIVEVETAKAAVEIPAKWAGMVAKIFHAEGSTVEVGTPIIAIDTDPSAGELPPEAYLDGPVPSAASLAAVRVAPAEGSVEPGMIGGLAPGGRTAVLVGYGPKTGAAVRRPRKDITIRSQPSQRVTPPPPTPPPAAPVPAAPPPTTPGQVLAKPPVRKLARDLGVDLGTLTGTGPAGSVTRADVHAAAEGTPMDVSAAASVSAPSFGPDRASRSRVCAS
jgi:pyruvate dehydrogenase E2 component (dihydrolipoamide acetyltransferase)